MEVAKWYCIRTLSHHSALINWPGEDRILHPQRSGYPGEHWTSKAQDPVQPWISLVCKLFVVSQNKGAGPTASGRKGEWDLLQGESPYPSSQATPKLSPDC